MEKRKNSKEKRVCGGRLGHVSAAAAAAYRIITPEIKTTIYPAELS